MIRGYHLLTVDLLVVVAEFFRPKKDCLPLTLRLCFADRLAPDVALCANSFRR